MNIKSQMPLYVWILWRIQKLMSCKAIWYVGVREAALRDTIVLLKKRVSSEN